MRVPLLLSLALSACAAPARPAIEHVVVLMMENRAFDHMLGMMSATNSAIDGCAVNNNAAYCSNPIDPSDPTSPLVHTSNDAVYVQPADPDHSVPATHQQMFGAVTDPAPGAVPMMNGFVANYALNNPNSTGGGPFIMKCFDPSDVPVITTLAQQFGMFNYWHADIPGPTCVNRAYADSATSHGMADNDVLDILLGYPQHTIFEDLDNTPGISWRGYFELIPVSWQFTYTRTKLLTNYFLFDQFAEDAATGNLANYTFIDPRYNDFFGLAASDQHPDHDVSEGEVVMLSVYESLRASPKWNNTLFLITYDEHGGFFDHVAPAPAPNPDGLNSTNPPFNFTRLGVRVPAVAISPWIKPGTIINNPTPVSPTEGMYYEHSSIPKTLHALFAPNAAPLTQREVFAAPFHTELFNNDLTEPRTDCPINLPKPASHRMKSGLGPVDGHRPLSGLQRELAYLAAGVAGHDTATATSLIEALPNEDAGARFVAEKVNAAFGKPIVPIPAAAPATNSIVASA